MRDRSTERALFAKPATRCAGSRARVAVLHDNRVVRRLSFNSAVAIAATAVVVTLVVLLAGAGPVQSVRRTLGLGSERALPAPPIEERGGVFAFAMTQQGSDEPVGWDPCEPIRFQVNPEGEPVGGSELIERAMERMSAATGLVFEDEGTTDERPFTAQFVPLGTDKPVVIGWSTPAEFAALAGDIAGLGGGVAQEGVLSHDYPIPGGVALDTDAFTTAQVAARPRTMEAIVLHEIGHVVGLAHVNEPTELMAAANNGQIDFGPGDREGLARLGSLPCS
jgi:Matrixin